MLTLILISIILSCWFIHAKLHEILWEIKDVKYVIEQKNFGLPYTEDGSDLNLDVEDNLI